MSILVSPFSEALHVTLTIACHAQRLTLCRTRYYFLMWMVSFSISTSGNMWLKDFNCNASEPCFTNCYVYPVNSSWITDCSSSLVGVSCGKYISIVLTCVRCTHDLFCVTCVVTWPLFSHIILSCVTCVFLCYRHHFLQVMWSLHYVIQSVSYVTAHLCVIRIRHQQYPTSRNRLSV